MGATIASEGPVADINTTPLIDVMLVLLIMFIITIPLQTHAVKVDTPAPTRVPPVEVNPLRNELSVDRAGTILWNGKAVSLIVLRQYLEASQRMAPIPELHVRPQPDARYEVVDQVLAVAKHAHVARMGFVNNEAYAGL